MGNSVMILSDSNDQPRRPNLKNCLSEEFAQRMKTDLACHIGKKPVQGRLVTSTDSFQPTESVGQPSFYRFSSLSKLLMSQDTMLLFSSRKSFPMWWESCFLSHPVLHGGNLVALARCNGMFHGQRQQARSDLAVIMFGSSNVSKFAFRLLHRS